MAIYGQDTRGEVQDLNVGRATPGSARSVQAANIAQTVQAQVVGKSSGQQVAESLLALGTPIAAAEMEKQAKREYVQGQNAVRQGKAIQELRTETPWYNRIFGDSATVRGAQAMLLQKASQDYYIAGMQSIEENDHKLDPAAYRAQQDSILATFLTGDPETDALITANAVETQGKLVQTQYKEHRAWVQRENKAAYEALGLSLVQALDTAQKAGKTDPSARDEAYQSVVGWMQRVEGMDEAAHRESVTSLVVTSLKAGQDAPLRALREQGVELDIQHEARIQAAMDDYEKAVQVEYGVEAAQAWASILELGELDPEPAKIVEAVAEFTQAFPDYITSKDMVQLFRLNKQKAEEKSNAAELAGLYFSRETWQLTGDKERQDARRAAHAVWDSTLPPEQANQMKLNYWGATGDVDDDKSNKWTMTLQNPFLGDGSIDPRFEDSLREYKQYYVKNPALASRHIKDTVTLARVEGVMQLVDNGALSVQDALRLWSVKKEDQVDARYLESPELAKDIDKQVAGIVEKDFASYFGFGNAGVANSSKVQTDIGRLARQIVSLTGNPTGAGAAAARIYARNHEVVAGKMVPTGGKPLSEHLGVPDATGDEVVQWFLKDKGKEFFGPDFSGKVHTVVDPQSGTLTMFPEDEEGSIFGGRGKAQAVYMKELGTVYDREVRKKGDDAAAEKVRKEREDKLKALRWSDDRSGIKRTDAERQAELDARDAKKAGLKQAVGTSILDLATLSKPTGEVGKALREFLLPAAAQPTREGSLGTKLKQMQEKRDNQ